MIWTPIPPTKAWPRWVIVLILVALALAMVFGISRAKGAAPAERACTSDAVRYCMPYINSRPNMIACLQAHRSELSPACRSVIRKGK